MEIELSWANFKTMVGTNKSRVRYIDRTDFYLVKYADDIGTVFGTSILKDSGSDQTDFETNYQSYANAPTTGSINVKSQPDPVPFAQPTYRTKRNAISDLVSCDANAVADIDFLLSAERYVTGGDIIIENAEIGDYVVAQVEDLDGVIPSPYRAAVCEAWPIVAQYIEKEFIMVRVPGSVQAGSISTMTIETYPLNAKITAGLYLCIEYHAVNSGSTRRIAINYHLTKKL